MAPHILQVYATVLVFAYFASAVTLPDNNGTTTELAVHAGQASRDVSTTDLERGGDQIFPVTLDISYIAHTAWSVFTWAAGLFGLANSAYGVYKDCFKEYKTRECILSSVGLVTGGLVTQYAYKSGLRVRVRSDNLLTYGTWTDPDEPRLTAEVHVPLDENGRILPPHLQKRAATNGTAWERYVTYYWDNEESQYLLYRQAHAADLGHENDGRFHHFRAQDSDRAQAERASAPARKALHRRLNKRSYGVVTDYLWENNNDQGMWQQLHDSIDKDDLARKVAGYLEDNSQEVSCLTVLDQVCSHGGCSAWSRINNGVIAYGWNDQPFDFQGRAADWVEQCKGSNTQ